MTPKNINQIARASSIVSNAVVTLIVATKFPPEVLGYFYLIYSLLFLQILFDMGLSKVAAQMIASYYGKADVARSYQFRNYFRRFYSSLMLGGGAMIFLLGLIVIPTEALWSELVIIPWTIAAVSVALSMKQNGKVAELEGIGKIRDVALSRAVSALVMAPFSILFLIMNLGLYAVPTATLMGTICAVSFLHRALKRENMANTVPTIGSEVSFKSEIWPFLRQTSLTWVFGFFSYYCYVPIITHVANAEEAGVYGLTAQIIFTISSFSLIVMQTSVFRYARKYQNEGLLGLAKIFRRDLAQSLLIYLALTSFILLLVYPLIADAVNGNQTIQGAPLVAMIVGGFAQTLYVAFGYYARAQNHERFYWVNIVNAGLTIPALLILASGGADMAAYIYFAVSVVSYLIAFPFVERTNIFAIAGG